MRRRPPARMIWPFVLALSATTAAAQSAPKVHRRFASPDAPRHSERVRTFDVQHIKTELTLDTEKSEARGTVTHTLTPLHPGLATVELDCGSRVKVSEITIGPGGSHCEFEHDGDTLRIKLDRPYDPGETIHLGVHYAAPSGRGIYFIKPDPDDDEPKQLTVWTQGEPDETHEWLPCYASPNDRATSETIVTVAKPLVVVSNGDLVETKENGDKVTYHWKMDVPHVSYLVSIAASDFAVYRDRAGDLPLTYYTSKSIDEATARRALGNTPKMVAFFNERLGIDYPYPKYAQVAVPDFTWGGMENISATTLNDTYTFRDAVSALEGDADGLVAHELAHQWFGDLLTCKEWAHVWLNEGFASYFDPLYTESARGEDAFRLAMARNFAAYRFSDRTQYRRPIVEPRYANSRQLFDGVTYQKGACVLHALRGLLGDEAWWAGIRRYLAENRAKVVETDDFRKAMEAASGKDLAWFFDQWVYKAGHPELKVRWRYEPEDHTARVKVEQTQALDDQTPLFRLPTTLELTDDSQTRSVPIVIDGAAHEFVIPSPMKPRMVRIDPKGWIPMTVDFERSREELVYQVEHDSSVLGRIDAARSLAKMDDDEEARRALDAAWSREQCPEARVEIVRLLDDEPKAHRDALRKAAEDPDARVRVVAFGGLAKLDRDDDLEALFRSAWSNEREAYGVRRHVLEGFDRWGLKDREELLTAALKVSSSRDSLATTALGLMLKGDSAEAREDAVFYSKPGRPRALRRVALSALGRLAKDDAEIQDALIALAEDQDRRIRLAAWEALANGKVRRALPALEARLKREGRDKGPLDSAIAALKRPDEPTPAAPPARAEDDAKVEELERRAAELELRAKEARNEAEALKLKRERERLGAPATPK